MTRWGSLVLGLALLSAPALSAETTSFVLSFDINQDLWEASDWAEPPQLALWLENETTGAVRTLFVTYRTAKDDWEGKSSCPPSLPYWVSRFQKEYGRDRGPSRQDPLPDAVTGATPKLAFSHAFEVGEGDWSLYLEVNVSGDYNEHYRKVSLGSRFEDFGNGQPSLVYRARDITGRDAVEVELIGMTAPARTPEERLVEPAHITSADRLVQGITLERSPARRISSYRNPVISGFHPDPSVTRVGEDYYLVNSSFEFFPGVPVFHSRDLVHWRLVGNALTRDSQLPLEGVGPSGGIFAPTIRHHDGTFYMITTNVSAGGNFFVTADDPAGPWSEPVWIRGQGGIDPSLFFDEDGTVYLTSTGGAPGTNEGPGIYQSTIDVATGELLSEPRLVWRGTGGRYPEGPHLYRIGGRYYLMISEGGTEYGHMVTVTRSDSPWGPFEPCPSNPILTHRDTMMDVPLQGTGHSDLVQDHEGRWWMVFLAFRPVGGYYWHHLGRETSLAPVTWTADGWPVVNDGEPVTLEMEVAGLPAHPFEPEPGRDDFEGPLGPAWNHLRNPHRSSYSTGERPGWLTLRGTGTTLSEEASPTFVGRRQEHLAARMATRLDFAPTREGDEAALVLYRHPLHHYELGLRAVDGVREVFLRQTVGPSLSVVTASARVLAEGPVVLEIRAEPTEYTFFWGISRSRLHRLGTAAPRLLSTEVTGGFVGTYVGLYATGSGEPSEAAARFDWFDYEPGAKDVAVAEGWQSLFDGATLAGWHVAARPADQGRGFWTVRDGAITADSLGRTDHDYVWLVSDAEYGDFELELEVRGFSRSPGNSGVQFRSRYDDALGWLHGPQVDVHPPAPWRTGLLYDETRETRRWIFPSLEDWRIEPAQGPAEWVWHTTDDGDGWNAIRLVCRGTRVETVVNGVVIADYDGAGVLDDAAHRRHQVGLRGHLALQLHSGDELLIQYRNIRLRRHPSP